MTAEHLLHSMHRRSGLWALSLICASAALRLWFVATGQLGLVQDEAQYWDWTRQLQLSYYSKGPLIAWIISGFVRIFGDTELGVRMGSLVGGTAFSALLWWVVARLWMRPVAAVLCVFLASVSPLFLSLGILMTTDNPLLLCWLAALASLYAASVRPPGRDGRGHLPFVLLALALGVGALAKYMMLLFVPLAVLYALLLRRAGSLPSGFWPRLICALVLGTLFGFLPVLIWNVQNGFVGFKHVLHLAGVSGGGSKALFRPARMLEYLGVQFGLALPWWFFVTLLGGWRAARLTWQSSATDSNGPPQDETAQGILLALCFWPLTVFLLFWSVHTRVLGNWNAVSFVAGTLLAGVELERLFLSGMSLRAWRLFVSGSVASLAVALLLFLHQLLPLPPGLNPAHRLKGWDDMGLHMSEVAAQRFADPARVFYMSDVYDITAALAFYVPGQPRAYCLWWHDRRMNQYDLWGGPTNSLGWDAVLVIKGDAPGMPPVLTDMFERVSGPYRYVALYRGQPVRPFFYYLCYGYRGLWPSRQSGVF